MKEIKSFFGNSNRLNKGYVKVRNPNELEHNSFYRKKFEHILPPIDIMEAYENMHPGTLGKLISMAEKEQVHRHNLDFKNLEANERLAVKVKTCALIFMIFLLLIFTVLSFCGKVASSTVVACFATGVGIIGVYNYLNRKKIYNRR